MSYLGRNIKKYRKQKGLTIKDLASRSNSSVSSISQIENGLRDATFKKILNIAQGLEMDIAELVKNEEQTVFKHYLEIVTHLGNVEMIIGKSVSNSNVIQWGVLVNLTEEKILDVIFFETSRKTKPEDFFNNFLMPYIKMQKGRILLRKDIEIKGYYKETTIEKIDWTDFKNIISQIYKIKSIM